MGGDEDELLLRYHELQVRRMAQTRSVGMCTGDRVETSVARAFQRAEARLAAALDKASGVRDSRHREGRVAGA